MKFDLDLIDVINLTDYKDDDYGLNELRILIGLNRIDLVRKTIDRMKEDSKTKFVEAMNLGLIDAVHYRLSSLTQILLEYGADPSEYATKFAARNGDLEMLKMLVPRADSINYEGFLNKTGDLVWAILSGCEDVVNFLLAAGAIPTTVDQLAALWVATKIGTTGMVRRLLDAGCDPYEPSGTEELVAPLGMAASRGDLALVQLFLQTPHVRKMSGCWTTEEALEDALHHAILSMHPNIVELLLQHKALIIFDDLLTIVRRRHVSNEEDRISTLRLCFPRCPENLQSQLSEVASQHGHDWMTGLVEPPPAYDI